MKKLGVDNMIDLVKHFAVVRIPDLGQNEGVMGEETDQPRP